MQTKPKYNSAVFGIARLNSIKHALLLFLLFSGFSVSAFPRTMLGAMYGNSGWDMWDVHNMEIWQGKKFDIVSLNTGFCNSSTVMNNLFTRALVNIWNNQNVPSINWDPSLCGTTTPSNIDQLIASGAYDSYINAWADGLKGFLRGPDGVFGTADDRRVYLRFAHEMNGTWYRWSANNSQTPWTFAAMWRHVHAIFESKGLGSSYVQWVFAVAPKDSGGVYTMEEYYPGDGYVDWFGIDAYNFGNRTYGSTTFTWKTPNEIFDNMIGRLRNLAAKPIGFWEVSSSAYYSGVNVYEKNLWINSLFPYARNAGVKLIIWVNEDLPLAGKSCCTIADWTVFGGSYGDTSVTISGKTYTVYSAFRNSVLLWWMTATGGSTNPRLLSDSQFSGVL
jgi:mannan endo-1,4-beta-mannosidase